MAGWEDYDYEVKCQHQILPIVENVQDFKERLYNNL